MKKYTNILLGLAGALAVSACSSVEEAPESPVANGDVTVNVVTGDVLNSRALGNVEGYTLNCVMQLLDQNGATVGTQAVAEAAGGTASFTIKHADVAAGATNAVFWAEYVPNDQSGKKVYDSSDLTNITYQTTEFDLADANLMKAADAFAGKLTEINATNTVTLTRPVSQVNFTPENPAVVAGATKLVVTYNTTSAYNVATQNCKVDGAGTQAVTLTNNAFSAEATPWFTTFIIMPANLTKFNQPIDMVVTTPTGDRTFTIEAEEIPADPNYIVNVSGQLSDEQDYVVDVTINGDYANEPQPELPAEFKVGAYVKADGTATTKVDEAVGVVYHMGAIEGDDATLYPAAFAGKTIKGYVVALENVSAARGQLNKDVIADGLTTAMGIINGTQNTDVLISEVEAVTESKILASFKTWTAAHPIGASTSGWYIPSHLQMGLFLGMLLPSETGEPATGSDEFKALFPMNTIYDRCPPEKAGYESCMYMSCTVNNQQSSGKGNVSGYNCAVDGGQPHNYKGGQIDVKTKTQSVLCRAMFTVFE